MNMFFLCFIIKKILPICPTTINSTIKVYPTNLLILYQLSESTANLTTSYKNKSVWPTPGVLGVASAFDKYTLKLLPVRGLLVGNKLLAKAKASN